MNKISSTPEPKRFSSASTSDVHTMCYSRVSMLTEEIEKISDVLAKKADETDLLIRTN